MLIFNGRCFIKKKTNCFTSVKVHSYQTQKTEFPLKRMGLNFWIFQRGTLFCIIFLCLKNTSCICNFSCTLYVIFYVPKTSIIQHATSMHKIVFLVLHLPRLGEGGWTGGSPGPLALFTNFIGIQKNSYQDH